MQPGPVPGVLGATIGEPGLVEVRGKRRDWVLAQATLLWSKLCRDRLRDRISATLTRADEQGPTLSGPIRKGVTIECELVFDGRTTEIVWGTTTRTLRRVSYPEPMAR